MSSLKTEQSLLIANALLAQCRVRFVFPKKFIFESFSMFDLIRGDHCNNTELEHFPSFYFPQEIYKKKSQNLDKTRLYLILINYTDHRI